MGQVGRNKTVRFGPANLVAKRTGRAHENVASMQGRRRRWHCRRIKLLRVPFLVIFFRLRNDQQKHVRVPENSGDDCNFPF